jgi:hypothetical protein
MLHEPDVVALDLENLQGNQVTFGPFKVFTQVSKANARFAA